MAGFGDEEYNTGLTAEEENLLKQQASGQLYEAGGAVADAGLSLIPVVGPLIGAAGPGKMLGKYLGATAAGQATKELDLIAKQRVQKEQAKADQLQAIQGLLGRWVPYQ